MGKVLDELKVFRVNSVLRNSKLNWDDVLYDYLDEYGHLKQIKYEIMRNVNDSSHVINILLGEEKIFCETVGQFIFNKYETSLSNDEIINSLTMAVESNDMFLSLKNGEVELILLVSQSE